MSKLENQTQPISAQKNSLETRLGMSRISKVIVSKYKAHMKLDLHSNSYRVVSTRTIKMMIEALSYSLRVLRLSMVAYKIIYHQLSLSKMKDLIASNS